MHRKQKTVKTDCSCEDRLEAESTMKVPSIVHTESAREESAERLLERILSRTNMAEAYKRVVKKGGSAGIDKMTVEAMFAHLKAHYAELVQSIFDGNYKPEPVKRVNIPKPDGGQRKLGIPTVIDRMVQQAISQILTPIFEKKFSASSYGFRPGRNAHQAIVKAKEYYEQGYKVSVDLDLAKYFDTVNHFLLIRMLREEIKDERVIHLIRKYLKSGVLENGLVSPTTEGTPQGGNLSPLLANIYLTKFDKLLESRGHKFVRYADDCNIYVKSRRAAQRVMTGCVKYLEGKLKLRVNREKSCTGSPLRLKFLGFSLYSNRGNVGIRIHAKSLKRFKDKIRHLTSRKHSRSITNTLLSIKRYTTGWLGYYSIADMGNIMKDISEWTRRRIRQIYWKQWKRIRAREYNLVKLGIDKSHAWQWANSRLGYWRIAGSWILSRSLTNKYLASQGYDDISERYEAMRLRYRTAVYRTVRTVV